MSQNQPVLPTILLVEPDNIVRPSLIENLDNWGYKVVVALSKADALQRTRASSQAFDLLLLNQFEQSIEQCLDMGRDIRQSANLSSSIPIVVMAERYGAELEGRDIQVAEGEYVAYLEDGQQLKDLLYQLCPV